MECLDFEQDHRPAITISCSWMRRRAAGTGDTSPADATTRFVMVPMCSMVISTTSPTCSGGGVSWPVRPQLSASEPEAQVPDARTSPALTHDARDACETSCSKDQPMWPDRSPPTRVAVDAHRHRQVEEAVLVAVAVELVGSDDPRPDRGREVLALGRPELELHLLALHVAGRPVVHDQVAADRGLRLLDRGVAHVAADDGGDLQLEVEPLGVGRHLRRRRTAR